MGRRAWGQALVAELAAIPGRGRRWRFAAAVLRIALFPPAPAPAAVRSAAATGVLVTVVATLAAARLLPTLTVFVAALGLLTSVYATAVACRWPRRPTSSMHLAAAAVVVAGVLAATGAVTVVAAAHPTATRDQTHVFSVVLAVALSGYLVAGLSATVTGSAARATLWGAVAGAGGAVAASALLLPQHGVEPLISPITAAATLITTVGVGSVTRSRPAATRAGLLTAVLSTPIHFAMALLVAQYAHPAELTNSYDIAAYPNSGYPDVASYVLSDTLASNIISLAITPVAMCALAMAVASLTPRLRRT
jgi:hypothetical protein